MITLTMNPLDEDFDFAIGSLCDLCDQKIKALSESGWHDEADQLRRERERLVDLRGMAETLPHGTKVEIKLQ